MKRSLSVGFLAVCLLLSLFTLHAASYPALDLGAQDAASKFEQGHAMSFAHKAAWHNAPENSLIAIYDCIMMGIDALQRWRIGTAT